MKNQFKITLLIFAVLTLYSCKKDSAFLQIPVEKNDLQAGLSIQPILESESAKKEDLRIFYDRGGMDYGCISTGGDCLPAIRNSYSNVNKDNVCNT